MITLCNVDYNLYVEDETGRNRFPGFCASAKQANWNYVHYGFLDMRETGRIETSLFQSVCPHVCSSIMN